MREKAQTFKDLIVWQKAHLFVLAEVSKLLEAYSQSIRNSDS